MKAINMEGASVEDATSGLGTMVVLVPGQEHRYNPSLYKTATADAKGHFVIRGGAPGVYNAFAWEFLAKYQSRGKVLSVQAGPRNEIRHSPVSTSNLRKK